MRNRYQQPGSDRTTPPAAESRTTAPASGRRTPMAARKPVEVEEPVAPTGRRRRGEAPTLPQTQQPRVPAAANRESVPAKRPAAGVSTGAAAPRSTLMGSGTIVGRVVRCQPRPRRKDFLHAYFGSLVNGAAFSFSPVTHVMTVDVSSGDYLTIDRNQRRTVVVNLVGRIYDGAIQEQDWVEVTGNWSANGTLNATRVFNTTNQTHVELSHAVPAAVVRLMTALVAGLIVWELLAGGLDLPSVTAGLIAALGPVLQLAALAAVGILALWVLLRPRRPYYPGRRFGGKLLTLLALGLLGWYLLFYAPAVLEAVMVLGLTLWGLWMLLSTPFR